MKGLPLSKRDKGILDLVVHAGTSKVFGNEALQQLMEEFLKSLLGDIQDLIQFYIP